MTGQIFKSAEQPTSVTEVPAGKSRVGVSGVVRGGAEEVKLGRSRAEGPEPWPLVSPVSGQHGLVHQDDQERAGSIEEGGKQPGQRRLGGSSRLLLGLPSAHLLGRATCLGRRRQTPAPGERRAAPPDMPAARGGGGGRETQGKRRRPSPSFLSTKAAKQEELAPSQSPPSLRRRGRLAAASASARLTPRRRVAGAGRGVPSPGCAARPFARFGLSPGVDGAQQLQRVGWSLEKLGRLAPPRARPGAGERRQLSGFRPRPSQCNKGAPGAPARYPSTLARHVERSDSATTAPRLLHLGEWNKVSCIPAGAPRHQCGCPGPIVRCDRPPEVSHNACASHSGHHFELYCPALR
ncbi:uncharacterized protein LOC122460469 [Dermochelys coriacea]|uniref:uncharacterized protein LOC122460469 n=1 Tax=Dermochelys coriacea TaxID=27794 RepID=UPI001CAA1674|nr:uncharacterized protein LOC122460469 [Dermochelys coriacea]